MNAFSLQILRVLSVILLSGFFGHSEAEENEPAKTRWSATVSGVVFSDGNGNSIFDMTDLPGKGLKVKLVSLDAEEMEIASLRTDEKGGFEFETIFEGQYRLEVFGHLKEVVKSDDFSVAAGKVSPFFAIQVNGAPRRVFRGRIADPKNTGGNIISPFSPASDKNLPKARKEEEKKTES